MHVTKETSCRFDPGVVVDSDHYGGVAWAQFNNHYHVLQTTDWTRINSGHSYGLVQRAIRTLMAYVIQRSDGILDLAGKAKWFWQMPIPPNPDIIFFGAEVGWEASILQALYGDGGRVVLVDNDTRAHQRFLEAPQEITIAAPAGFRQKDLVVTRNLNAIEYVREDLFAWKQKQAFDVGLDWGLIEHFSAPRKRALMATMQRFLRPSGLQISAVPRNTWITRRFYRAFADELNFGYRELMSPSELKSLLLAGGYHPERILRSPTTVAAWSRLS